MRTLLIDGNNLLYRTFWAANYKAKNQDPGNIAATYIFLRTLKSYADKFSPWDKIYCAWDKRLAYPEGNFRSEICDTEYKGGRGDKKFENVFDSLEIIIPLIEELGICNFYPHRMEADDVISWLSGEIEGEKIIITTDKDMLQLINEDISVFNTNTKSIINLENFEDVTNIDTPRNYLMFKCFTGDKSDNIPGIPKVGIKTFLKLTKDWDHNLDNVDINKNQRLIVERNKRLMDLKYGFNYYKDETISYRAQYYSSRDGVGTNDKKPNYDKFSTKCRENGLKSIYENINQWKSTFTPKKNNILSCINNIKERYCNNEHQST
jgi:DNA polymerase I